jgi:outer membrane lipoprotein-sorting protein
VLAWGCALEHEDLPTYPHITPSQARIILSDRAHSIRTVSGDGTITLTRPDHDSVRLDGAIALQPPDRARLRAWKFNQAVFDLTLSPQGLFLVGPSDPKRAGDVQKAGASAAQVAQTWSDLTGRFFDSELQVDALSHAKMLVFRQVNRDQSVLRCAVDKRTVTPRSYSLSDPSGQERFRLDLDRYAIINGIPFPRRLTATSEQGQFQVDLRQVELNGELPAGAFTPPARAQKITAP